MRITKMSAAALAATLSFGGAALAFADDAMPADPTLETGATTTTVAGDPGTTTTTVVEEPTTTTTVVDEPTTTTTAVGDEGERAEGEDEGEGTGATHEHPDNHGKIVSEAAHATPPGPGHGKAVSEVARSTNHGHTKGAGASTAKAHKKPKK
jgi:hypothetical protein